MTLKRKRSQSHDQGNSSLQPLKKQRIAQVNDINNDMEHEIIPEISSDHEIKETNETSQFNHDKLEVKPIDDRMNDIFSNLNSQETGLEYQALSEIERGCHHALRVRESYFENEHSDVKDKADIRNKIQQQSILFRFLSLSPHCVELMNIWEKRFKDHNKKICGRIMEILALIIESNYFQLTRKSTLVISRTVVKDKLRLIYSGFSGAFSPKGKIIIFIIIIVWNKTHRMIFDYFTKMRNFEFVEVLMLVQHVDILTGSSITC